MIYNFDWKTIWISKRKLAIIQLINQVNKQIWKKKLFNIDKHCTNFEWKFFLLHFFFSISPPISRYLLSFALLSVKGSYSGKCRSKLCLIRCIWVIIHFFSLIFSLSFIFPLAFLILDNKWNTAWIEKQF